MDRTGRAAFQQFQMRKRAMLGKDYEPPVYLD